MVTNRQQQMQDQFEDLFNLPTEPDPETPQEPTEKVTAKKTKRRTAPKKKRVTEAETKSDKRLITLYMTATTITKLKKYAAMTQQPIGDVAANAIAEYLQNHKPTKEQREAYEARRKEEDIDL